MRLISFFSLLFAFTGCFNSSKTDEVSSYSSIFNPELITKIEASFVKRNIKGCFILYDFNKDTSIVYNKQRASKSFLPASTYKILNSLIALECKVIEDENEIIEWDGVEHSVPVWNQDHNMRTGIKNSVVWLYQEMARKIGKEQMQKWVDSVGYGNQNIGNNIDDFWLVGNLRISPKEQVEFLKKLIKDDLPFHNENIQIVKEILIEDQKDNYTFRAKTGWADFGTPVGWYVGYIEIDGNTFVFINNIEIQSNEDAKARKEITKEVFKAAFKLDLDI